MHLLHLLILVSFWYLQLGKTSPFWIPQLDQDQVVSLVGRPHPSIRMHLSLDTMNMVDDSCLSPSNFHEMVKAGGMAVGTRVHSIDVILGFNKDQDPLLNPCSNAVLHKVGGESLGDPGKQDQRVQPYGQLPPLRDGLEQPAFHGKFFIGQISSVSCSYSLTSLLWRLVHWDTLLKTKTQKLTQTKFLCWALLLILRWQWQLARALASSVTLRDLASSITLRDLNESLTLLLRNLQNQWHSYLDGFCFYVIHSFH